MSLAKHCNSTKRDTHGFQLFYYYYYYLEALNSIVEALSRRFNSTEISRKCTLGAEFNLRNSESMNHNLGTPQVTRVEIQPNPVDLTTTAIFILYRSPQLPNKHTIVQNDREDHIQGNPTILCNSKTNDRIAEHSRTNPRIKTIHPHTKLNNPLNPRLHS